MCMCLAAAHVHSGCCACSPLPPASLLPPLADCGLVGEEGVGKVIITLMGEGTPGAVSFQPAALDAGPLRVGYPHTTHVTLVNQSDGCVRYSLLVAADQEEEGQGGTWGAGGCSVGGPLSSGEAAVDWSSGPGSLAAGSGQPGAPSTGMQHHAAAEAWVEEPEGTLDAWSSKQVGVGTAWWHRHRTDTWQCWHGVCCLAGGAGRQSSVCQRKTQNSSAPRMVQTRRRCRLNPVWHCPWHRRWR